MKNKVFTKQFVAILLFTFQTYVLIVDANLCAVCESLRDHLPDEFHSCVFKNLEIKHCNESFDFHLSSLKIVGVKRIIRVNYEENGAVYWEVGVNVVQDGNNWMMMMGESHHQHSPNNASSSSSSQHHHSTTTVPHHNSNSNNNNNHNNNDGTNNGASGGGGGASSSSTTNEQHSVVQLAVIRFKSYPYKLLLQNPCRHVLGTINYNSMGGASGRRNINKASHQQHTYYHVPSATATGSAAAAGASSSSSSINAGATMQQRISPAYFVIDDKMCRGGSAIGHRGIGVRRKCTPTFPNQHQSNNGSIQQQHQHPYECCTPLKQNQCSTTTPPHQSNRVDEQSYLRPLTISVQAIAICFTLIISCVVFWIRKSKVIQVSVWPLTESIIFGSTLLYGSVLIRASVRFDVGDPPTTGYEDGKWWNDHKDKEPDQGKYWSCVAEPWCRELGFTFVYGGVVLKIYRSLVEFRTRKAHRWVVREKDILRYLGTTVAVVLFYLVAWSVTVGEFGQQHEGEFTMISSSNNDGDGINDEGNEVVCPAVTNWHRVTEIGELLYIAVGLNMAWHLRTSPVSPFLERQMYTAALVLEATASVLLIVVRECKLMFFSSNDISNMMMMMDDEVSSSSSSYNAAATPSSSNNNSSSSNNNNNEDGFLLLIYFIRCHVTTTVILALVLGPKLYYVYIDATTRKRAGALRRGDTLTTTTGGGGGGGGAGGGSVTGPATTGPPTSASLSNLSKLPPHALVGVDHHTLIDLDFAEVSLAEMDPQDIKMELKRVYTQLELLRNKTMRKDNPHISKRRGGRKPTHRRFSLQKKGSRDKTAAAAAAMRSRMQALDQEGRNNRYSGRYNDDIEDSVCSIEGPSTYSEVGAGYR